MTDLHFKFSGLSLGGYRLCIQSSTSKSRQNQFVIKITGKSVLNNLICRCLANRLYIKEENDLFSLCIKDGTLKIGHTTKNRYVHNRTERF